MNRIAFLAALSKSDSAIKPLSLDHLPLLDWKNLRVHDFYFEIVAVTAIILYVAAFMYGTRDNKKKARKFLNAHIDIWKQNFYSIGDGNKQLVQDGPKDFVLFGSGRLFCKSATATLSLVGKQDFLAYAMGLFYGMQKEDKITVNVKLDDDQSDNIIFSVLRRTKLTSTLKDRWDLDNLAKPKDYADFPAQDYVILTDSIEFSNAVWALESFKDLAWQSLGISREGEGERFNTPVLEQIILTDTPAKTPETMEDLKCGKSLQFVFNIGELEGRMLEIQPLISQFVFDFIDTLGTKGKLSAEAKVKSKKLRAATELVILKKEEKKRMAELADKKVAERKAKEAALLKLSPEAQRKAEEKLKKKDAKKTLSKQMKVKRH